LLLQKLFAVGLTEKYSSQKQLTIAGYGQKKMVYFVRLFSGQPEIINVIVENTRIHVTKV
jgi:hypothetical protein